MVLCPKRVHFSTTASLHNLADYPADRPQYLQRRLRRYELQWNICFGFLSKNGWWCWQI